MSNWRILEANPLEQKNTGGRFPGLRPGRKARRVCCSGQKYSSGLILTFKGGCLEEGQEGKH